eukprot:1975176-Rhodomonas_salina.3
MYGSVVTWFRRARARCQAPTSHVASGACCVADSIWQLTWQIAQPDSGSDSAAPRSCTRAGAEFPSPRGTARAHKRRHLVPSHASSEPDSASQARWTIEI